MTRTLDYWDDARTLQDLGELTAMWLEGEIEGHPIGGPGGCDDETDALVPVLTQANRAGYVTTNSQPGKTLTGAFGQRATVSGFCTEATADKIQAAILGTDLIAIVTPPGWTNPVQIPITIDDSAPHSWAGGAIDEDNIDHYFSHYSPRAIPELLAAWQVDVIDPQWGRNDLLWPVLTQALA